jgi:hypothetical protein
MRLLPPLFVTRALLGAALAAVAGSAAAVAPNPEPLDMDPDILAELARHKVRAAQQRQSSLSKPGKPGEKPAADCGAVSIGNVLGNGRIGFAPIDVNVVIVGDVINANNQCR